MPIEQAVNGVERSIYMSSTSGSDGSYTLTITFDVGTDLDTSLTLVQNLVTSALAQLPRRRPGQGVTVKKVSTDILLVVSLYSEDDRFDESFLSNYGVINLQNPLARLPGRRPGKGLRRRPLQHAGLAGPQQAQTLQSDHHGRAQCHPGQNVQVVAGQLGAPPVPADQAFQFTINTLGRLSDAKQFENIIVKSARAESAQIVRLRDVARVELGQQTYTNFAG